jgi:hypothetical protein
MKNILFLSSLALILLNFQACQKSDKVDSSVADLSTNLTAAVAEVVNTTVNTATVEDVQSASVTKFEGLGMGFQGGPGFGSFHLPKVSSCATVTVSSSTYPKEITIDYGTGCADHRGLIKKGKIIVTISDTLSNAGATQTITYQDFYIDSMKVELSGTIKNLGKNDQGNWVIQSKQQQTITKPNGDKKTEVFDESIEWLKGFDTADRIDDSYYKTGSGSINLNDTATYSRTITKALLFEGSCHFIVSGTVELNKNGSVVVLDYGDGTCDSKATVTTNGTTEEIDLFSSRFGEKGKFGKHCHGFGGNGNGWFGF